MISNWVDWNPDLSFSDLDRSKSSTTIIIRIIPPRNWHFKVKAQTSTLFIFSRNHYMFSKIGNKFGFSESTLMNFLFLSDCYSLPEWLCIMITYESDDTQGFQCRWKNNNQNQILYQNLIWWSESRVISISRYSS